MCMMIAPAPAGAHVLLITSMVMIIFIMCVGMCLLCVVIAQFVCMIIAHVFVMFIVRGYWITVVFIRIPAPAPAWAHVLVL